MKKIILLATVCILTSSCSLFRTKTQSIDRRELEILEQKESRVALSGTLEGSKITLTQFDKTTQTEENTTIEADEINIDKNGNITAKGAKLTTNKKSGESDKSRLQIDEETKAGFSLESDSASEKKVAANHLEKNTKTDTSPKGIIWGTVAIIVFLFAILWYFGIFPGRVTPK